MGIFNVHTFKTSSSFFRTKGYGNLLENLGSSLHKHFGDVEVNNENEEKLYFFPPSRDLMIMKKISERRFRRKKKNVSKNSKSLPA